MKSASHSFCPQLEDLLVTNRATGASGKVFENPTGHSTVNNLLTLRSLMHHLKAERTLETGLAFGGSCLLFTSTHREMGHAPDAQHVAIDPLQRTMFDLAGVTRVEKEGLRPYLDFRGDSSVHVLPHLLREDKRFDLIYIDGSHLFEEVLIDCYYCTRLLREGGIMALDDSTVDQVAKAIAFLRTNQTHCLREVDLAPHRADEGKSLKYRAAKLLNKAQLTAFERHGNPERQAWAIPLNPF
jgi:predicted O-methyltransferase YrrM